MHRFFCDNCGTEAASGLKNCPGCGRPFAAVRCPACGFVGEEPNFAAGCPACGHLAPKLGKTKPATAGRRPAGSVTEGNPFRQPLWAFLFWLGLTVLALSLLFFALSG